MELTDTSHVKFPGNVHHAETTYKADYLTPTQIPG